MIMGWGLDLHPILIWGNEVVFCRFGRLLPPIPYYYLTLFLLYSYYNFALYTGEPWCKWAAR